MLNTPFIKILSLYLAVAILVLSLPSSGWAMFIRSDQAATARLSDTARIQTGLESEVIKQRLQDYGLSSEETSAKLNSLSDEQVHQVAAQMDAVQAGGDGLGGIVFLLLVVIIVVVVLQATGHRIVIH